MRRSTAHTLLSTLITLALVSPTAWGQDESDDGDAKLPPLPETLRPGAGDPREQMQKLFHQVERNLRRIDDFLNDAGAGDTPLQAPEDSGLDDLLRETQQNSKQVISDIDRILELARQNGGQSMAPPQQGESPLDKPRSGGEQDREQTPEEPGDQQHGEQQDDDQQGRPESPGESEGPGETLPGAPHEPESGEATATDPDSDEWGMLPPRTRELFRNEGNSDLPVKYRDWIDAYYKRLNETRP